MMTARAPAIDTRIGICSGLGALVAEELSDDFKGSRRGIELKSWHLGVETGVASAVFQRAVSSKI